MASLERRGDRFRIIFRHAGKRFTHSLKTTDPGIANGLKGGIEKTLMLLDQKVLQIPAGADLLSFVINDGHGDCDPTPPIETNGKSSIPLTLRDVGDRYIETHSAGAMETNSLNTVAMHVRHFVKTLKTGFPLQSLDAAALQSHIDRRARMTGIRKRRLSPATIRKEMASLRAVWTKCRHSAHRLRTGEHRCKSRHSAQQRGEARQKVARCSVKQVGI